MRNYSAVRLVRACTSPDAGSQLTRGPTPESKAHAAYAAIVCSAKEAKEPSRFQMIVVVVVAVAHDDDDVDVCCCCCINFRRIRRPAIGSRLAI